MPVRPARKTQQERRADTTGKLLAATIDLLHDRGLQRLSTTDIADHAGVSRGALAHHFPSKEALLVAAIGGQLREATASLHRMAADIRDSGGSSDAIVDFLWAMMSDRLFYVTMEYLPEARHNPEFRAQIVVVVREFHEGLNAVWAELARRTGIEVEHALVLMNATMCLIRGMIAQTTVRDDPDYFRSLLDFWKERVARDFAPARPAEPGRDARPPRSARA